MAKAPENILTPDQIAKILASTLHVKFLVDKFLEEFKSGKISRLSEVRAQNLGVISVLNSISP